MKRLTLNYGLRFDYWNSYVPEQHAGAAPNVPNRDITYPAVTGVPLADYRRRFLQDWVNLTVLRWPDADSGPLLVLLNDMAHIDAALGAP